MNCLYQYDTNSRNYLKIREAILKKTEEH